MLITQIASAIYNDVVSGLRGFSGTPTMSLKQLEDEVIEERQVVIKEWFLKGILTRKDMMLAINCIEVDCKDAARCCNIELGEKQMHFEIPQLVNDLDIDAIEFIGSVDRAIQYVVYNDTTYQFHKYKKRSKYVPYVYIETTPNENGMYDGWIFNAPFVKYISVIGIFKDPRQLEYYDCCYAHQYLDLNSISNEVKKRLTEKKLRYYRQFLTQVSSNDQIPK